ncbi:hypothetical protein [Agrococcus sp. Marseille-Q4369]|uniref:hypothetical protein n=1 Tax=Agrococcus sp. Marseille-Q4369 TaxID=2810513 RepID=UPI001B8B1045|nr:hypothetical protein [Agrococcus sp. Marseille-Q4369]QUW18867.1 hypothetical protein JSQ78_00325 [Agrococcus sp. Marseille-Q4369]
MSIQWPSGLRIDPIGEWPGTMTRHRERSRFDSPMSATMDTLRRELWHLSAKNAALQVAIPASAFRLDGYPRSTAKAEHPGVILTLDSKHGALSYPCDTFDRWEDNLRAIALALEALRKVDRYGVTKRGEQYRGFLAIEATAAPSGFANAGAAEEWLQKLVVDGGITLAGINSTRALVRIAQRLTHPDRGGSAEDFQRVGLAVDKLREQGWLP